MMDLPAYPKCFSRRSALRASQSQQDIGNSHLSHAQVKDKIDKHNRSFSDIWKLGKDIGSVDNELVRQYTDTIYEEYSINNMFKSQEPQQQKSATNKKQIRLSKKLNSSCLYIETLCQSPTPNQNKENVPLSSGHVDVATKQSQNKTPDKKLLKIKKSEIVRSTAHSHMRSKTGITCLQSIGVSGAQDGSRGCSAKKGRAQEGVEVSEFGEYSLGANYSKLQVQKCSRITRQQIQTNLQYAQIYTSMLQASPLKPEHQSLLCPICESQIRNKAISEHQKECKELQTLYSLSGKQLQMYLQWKINQHLQTITTILANLKLPQGQNLDSVSDLECFLGESEKGYYGEIMEQCQQEIRKCIWFQSVKEKLVSTNNTC